MGFAGARPILRALLRARCFADLLPPRATMSAPMYWIDAPLNGRLAIAARPRAGDWLSDEISAWRVEAADTVVSLLEPEEVQELGLSEEADLCRKVGVEFVAFPVPDRGVPASLFKTIAIAQDLADQMQNGKSVIIHCRAGIGRSALLAACVLVRAGIQADKVFEMIAASRGLRVPDTDDQIRWLHDFVTISR
jgi:predicted protein tyrosine phosphatase